MKQLSLLFILLVSILISCSGDKKKTDSISETSEAKENSMKNSLIISTDTFKTSNGNLKVTLVGHASLIFEYGGKIIHIDPFSSVADYSQLPKADLLMITHEHHDHLDTSAINNIKKEDTHFITSQIVADILGYGEVMNNNSKTEYNGITIEAIPAYNIVHKKDNGEFYHPKGRGNGYVLTFGDKKVYVAGDTENIPEMDKLKNTIEIAFLPKNLPYTMSDEMFIDAVQKVQPKYLYPYHMTEYNETKINEVLKNTDIEILLRPMSNKKETE